MSKIIMLILAYLIGAIPSGYLYVKLKTGKDVRTIQSGRTGGTNSMRAAGVGVGIATLLTDFGKAIAAILVAKAWLPDNPWIHALTGLLVIIGHNYNIFMARKDENGKWKMGGGAGGSPALGVTSALWFPAILIAGPLSLIGLYFIGYASVATIISGSCALLIYIITGLLGITPIAYIAYGAGALILLLISLKENIKRLKNGTERLHGFRARKQKQTKTDNAAE